MPSDRPSLTVTLTDGGRETLVARIRGVDGMPGLDFDGQYRPLATARQVRATAREADV